MKGKGKGEIKLSRDIKLEDMPCSEMPIRMKLAAQILPAIIHTVPMKSYNERIEIAYDYADKIISHYEEI